MTAREIESIEELTRAAEILGIGGVVAVPTDTVYGLAVDPAQTRAVDALFNLKQRPETVALPVLVADPGDAGALAVLDERARALSDRYWPGPLTIVAPRRPGTELHLGGDGTSVGIRCPSHPLTRRLLSLAGPLAVTSANLHGGSPALSAAEVRALFGTDLELVLDGGRLAGGPSTVVSLLRQWDAGDGGVDCLRVGAVPLAEIIELCRGKGTASPGRDP